MHRVDQHPHVFWIDVGRDAVAEVEHVPGAGAERGQGVGYRVADDGEQISGDLQAPDPA